MNRMHDLVFIHGYQVTSQIAPFEIEAVGVVLQCALITMIIVIQQQ